MTDELKHIIQLIDDMRDNRVIEAAIRAHVQKAIDDEKQNPWKGVLIDELIVDNILTEELERDPRKALAVAIDWNCKVALDPSVSKEAMELQQQAIDAALESVADLLDSGDDWNTGDEIAEFIRSHIGTNPLAERAAEYARGIEFRAGQLAERDARIAELERELSEQADTIVDGLAKRRELERELAEARKDAKRYEAKLFALGAMEEPPCFKCGYNGPGYFQTATHPCAHNHHNAIRQEEE